MGIFDLVPVAVPMAVPVAVPMAAVAMAVTMNSCTKAIQFSVLAVVQVCSVYLSPSAAGMR